MICHLVRSNVMTWIALYTSSYNFVMLTFERHSAIVNPLGYHADKVRRRLPAIFVAEWLLMSLVWLFIPVTTVYANGRCRQAKRIVGTLWLDISSPFLFVFSIGIPLPIITVCYARMLYTLYRTSHSKRSTSVTTNEKALHAAQVNILQTCIIMLIAFVVSWTTSQSAWMLATLGWYDTCLNAHFSMGRLMIVISSAINPYIWAIRHKEFQQQLKHLLGLKR